MGARLICIQKVTGSIPVSSTLGGWRSGSAVLLHSKGHRFESYTAHLRTCGIAAIIQLFQSWDAGSTPATCFPWAYTGDTQMS